MLKKELDRLLWKINYRDISWARPFPLASSDECEVGFKTFPQLLFYY